MTAEDISAIKFFWLERGSLERWADWKDKLPMITCEYPELVKAWDDYIIARSALTDIVSVLEIKKEGAHERT